MRCASQGLFLFYFQSLTQGGVGVDVGGAVVGVDHHTRLGAGGLFHIPCGGIVHRHLHAVRRLGVGGGEDGRLLQRPVGRCLSLGENDDMRAGDIFGGSAMWKLLQLGAAPESLTQTQLQQIVTFACTAATLSTTKPGGASSVPTLEEIQKICQ